MIRRERVDEILAQRKQPAAPQPAARSEPTQAWENWITGQIKRAIRKHDRVLADAVGDALVEQKAARERAIGDLRREVEALRQRVEQLEARQGGGPALRSVG